MRKAVILVWLLFIGRGAFYGSMLPLWEGFDEWGHFAVIEKIRVSRSMLIDRNSRVSREIDTSLKSAPLPIGMTTLPPEGVTQDKYPGLPAEEKLRREKELNGLPPQWANEEAPDAGMPAYEASQPPLYYWITALITSAAPHRSLLDRVWFARAITLLIGSLVIPIGFSAARLFWKNDLLALGTVASVALMPGLALAVSRVSNESLAIVLYSAFLLALMRWADSPEPSKAILVGTLLGLGLLTKAYFLTAIPALLFITLWIVRRRAGTARSPVLQAVMMITVAAIIAGWWYARTYLQTGTLSGLDEALMLKNMGLVEKVLGALHVNWLLAVTAILLSHVWYGGWSLLALPRWIYVVWFGLLAVATWGVFKHVRQRTGPWIPLFLVLYSSFWAGQAYQIVMLFLSKHSSTAMGGWYLQSLIIVEALLVWAGIRIVAPARFHRHAFVGILLVVAATDLYGLHAVSIPYYAHAKSLMAIDLSRLLLNKPGFIDRGAILALWACYLGCTIGLVALGIRASLSAKPSGVRAVGL